MSAEHLASDHVTPGHGDPGQRRRRRATPISDGLGADLNTLGTILANHTRGLDDFLQRQGQRLSERHQTLLKESADLLLPGGLDLDALSTRELQSLCRERKLRGWSKLRRDALLDLLRRELGSALGDTVIQEDPRPSPRDPRGAQNSDGGERSDATRTERLLLLLLSHLEVPRERVEAAWSGQPPS